MPKMKTDKGAAKRVKITGTGRLRRRSRDAVAPTREEAFQAQASPRHVRPTSRLPTFARYGGCSGR